MTIQWKILGRGLKAGCSPFFSAKLKSVGLRVILFKARGSFLESPDNLQACKAVLVYMQDRGFSSFGSNMITRSVNETKWSSLLARIHALILHILI